MTKGGNASAPLIVSCAPAVCAQSSGLFIPTLALYNLSINSGPADCFLHRLHLVLLFVPTPGKLSTVPPPNISYLSFTNTYILVVTRWGTPQVGDREETGTSGKIGVLSETFGRVVPREFQRWMVRLG